VQTVNARDIHSYLEVGKDFSSWIKDRISKYEFVENQDFICSPVLVSEGRGGQNRIEYHVSLDMGKELAMVERTSKGKEVRKYFIAVEKEYRSKQESQFKIPKTLSEALQLAADQAKQIEYQNEKIEVMTPKAEYYDQLLGSEELSDGEMAAKTLRTSRNKLYAFLKQRGVITKSNLPMQLYIDKDYMRIKNTPYNDVFGNPKMSCKIMFTQKGIQYIRMMFNELLVNIEHQVAA
jgi:anti-repressor protein